MFEAHINVATVVQEDHVDAYPNVGRAHRGFIHQHPNWEFDLVVVSNQ